MIPDKLRPVLARVIGVIVASAATALFRHLGHELTDDQKQTVSDLGVALILGVWGLVYAGVHKAVSVKTNPTDAAAPKIAAAATGRSGGEKREQLADSLKAMATGEMPTAPPTPTQEFAHDPTKPPVGGF